MDLASKALLFSQFFYLLFHLTLAQLRPVENRQLNSNSGFFKNIASVAKKAEESVEDITIDPEDKRDKHTSEWFDGPPRLNCSLPLGTRVTEDTFVDPFVVACMRANPYDTSQLPLQTFGLRELLYVRYLFALNHLVDVDKDGKLTLVITLKLIWYLTCKVIN